MINRNFWIDKTVAVTGHTGFKGSWLTFWLSLLGAKIAGYALNPNDEKPLFDQLNLSSNISDHRGDINDLKQLHKILTDSKPQILFHLAAQSLVRESYKNPLYTFQTNVMGTANVLEVSRSIPSLRVIVVVTSDKCYENVEQHHFYKESDKLGGLDPYSSSKGCAELVTRSYQNSFLANEPNLHMGVATARAGNVIGGGDWATDRLVPDAMRAFSSENQLQIRFPNARRPWQHVFEPLCGYLLLAEHLWEWPQKFSGSWNFGPESSGIVTVGTISDFLAKSFGPQASWTRSTEENNPHEATLLHLDITKAVNQLDWKPRWSLELAVDYTVNWYKSFYSGKDMKAFSTEQLSDYENATARV